MRLLLIEDDPWLGKIIEEGLHEECYAVDWLRDGQEADLALQVCDYDLLILDLNLPGKSGMSILRTMRASGVNVPVLIISGHDAKCARVDGLDAGADDYLVKPFAQEELQARVRALLRRACTHTHSTITHRSLVLNLASHEVTLSGQLIKLPRREFSVLRALLDNPGAVMSKQQIEEKLYGWNTEIGSNTVDVHICQLRKKLGSDFIQTLRGVGYRIP